MNMQHKRGQFSLALPIVVRTSRLAFTQEKSDRDAEIRIDQLSMASRGVVGRIAADYQEMTPAWFCLRVVSGRESAVEKLLIDADVEVLVVRSGPYKVVRRGRIRTVPARPVISGYVLVRCLNLHAAMAGLLHVDDVLDIVGGASSPYRIRDEEVTRFKALADDGKYEHRAPMKVGFMVGEEVRVTDGPFASFPGIVVSLDQAGKFRVSVEVSIFGRSTPVELDIAQIEKM